MPIYPSHRDGRYSEIIEARTQWNAQNTRMVNGIDGLHNFTGGPAFPIPKSGAEVMWNARLNQAVPIAQGLYDEIAVYPNGDRKNQRTQLYYESPFANTDRKVGVVDEDISPVGGFIFVKIVAPAREKGTMLMMHEPLDQVRNQRKAWIFLPGSGRVRRAANAGFDTPVGPGGRKTVDDNLGFNGSMERYDWNLIGKKEIFIPYHSYRFDDPDINYADLLSPKHANPSHMRYELHRVWIVEATLKAGQRHIYEKRRFYLDEDNWLIALNESFDGHGELWRVGVQNSLYDFHLQSYITRVLMIHDLQAKAYIASGLVNDTKPTNYNIKAKGEKFFTPASLRKLARK